MSLAPLDVLLACLNYNPQPGNEERLEAIPLETWKTVAHLADFHGVAPYLYLRAKRHNIPLPPGVAAGLRQIYLKNLARNMQIEHRLDDLLRLFNHENIPVILLKGAYLAAAVYDEPGLRVMSDVDVLLPQREMERALRLLQAAGYTSERPFWPEVDGELHYHAPPIDLGGILVELHWDLTQASSPLQIHTDKLWERAEKMVLRGNEVLHLGLSDLILYLAVHAAYGHRYHIQFRALCDLAEVFRKFGTAVNWPELARTCQGWHAEKGVYLTLRLVRDLLEVGLPARQLEALKPAAWDEMALAWARVRLLQSEPILSENYIRLTQSPNLTGKIQALFAGLFPARKAMSMMYGLPPSSWRIWLRYPVHAASRLWKYKDYAWKLVKGDDLQRIESDSDQSLRQWLELE